MIDKEEKNIENINDLKILVLTMGLEGKSARKKPFWKKKAFLPEKEKDM